VLGVLGVWERVLGVFAFLALDNKTTAARHTDPRPGNLSGEFSILESPQLAFSITEIH
jgi:hypothetical protein